VSVALPSTAADVTGVNAAVGGCPQWAITMIYCSAGPRHADA